MDMKKHFITVRHKPDKWWKIFTIRFYKDRKFRRAARDLVEHHCLESFIKKYRSGTGWWKVEWNPNSYQDVTKESDGKEKENTHIL